jgi:hypothetical protein
VLAALVLLQATGAAPPPVTGKCDAAEYAAFDFWVGEWDVYSAGTDKLVAHSRIEKLYAGCGIRENWMPLSGNAGGSLTARDPFDGLWRQTWVGSAPGPVNFSGGPAEGKMVLTGWWPGSGPKGKDGLTRMTYSPLKDGSCASSASFQQITGSPGRRASTSSTATTRMRRNDHCCRLHRPDQ